MPGQGSSASPMLTASYLATPVSVKPAGLRSRWQDDPDLPDRAGARPDGSLAGGQAARDRGPGLPLVLGLVARGSGPLPQLPHRLLDRFAAPAVRAGVALARPLPLPALGREHRLRGGRRPRPAPHRVPEPRLPALRRGAADPRRGRVVLVRRLRS